MRFFWTLQNLNVVFGVQHKDFGIFVWVAMQIAICPDAIVVLEVIPDAVFFGSNFWSTGDVTLPQNAARQVTLTAFRIEAGSQIERETRATFNCHGRFDTQS